MLPIEVFLGIDPDGRFQRVVHVPVSNQHMRPRNRIDCWVSDIGEFIQKLRAMYFFPLHLYIGYEILMEVYTTCSNE